MTLCQHSGYWLSKREMFCLIMNVVFRLCIQRKVMSPFAIGCQVKLILRVIPCVIELEGQGSRMWNRQERPAMCPEWMKDGKQFVVTLRGWVTHICFSAVCHYWFRQWLVPWSAPSHCLNRWWFIIVWASGNIFQRKINIFPSTLLYLKISSAKCRLLSWL